MIEFRTRYTIRLVRVAPFAGSCPAYEGHLKQPALRADISNGSTCSSLALRRVLPHLRGALFFIDGFLVSAIMVSSGSGLSPKKTANTSCITALFQNGLVASHTSFTRSPSIVRRAL